MDNEKFWKCAKEYGYVQKFRTAKALSWSFMSKRKLFSLPKFNRAIGFV